MISVHNVTFAYDGTRVLDGISYVEKNPVITGLWGRNGVGKTTFMKLLAGHMKPSNGEIEIMGHQPYNNPEAQQYLCYMQEDHPFSEIWTVGDALRFYKYFNPNWNQALAEQLLDIFKLPVKRKTKKLSTGMKTALQLVIGLASQADITILDEPTNGLDASMRKKFYELLLESYDAFPRMIFVSTHHIEEIKPLLESIVVVHDGKLLLHEPMEEVREKGIWLTGESNQVNKLVANKKVLEESTMGSIKKVMIDDSLTDEWRELARISGLSLEKAQLQDYLLQLTESIKEVSA
ncbi:ABC transporter ATP-binding protein [Paenibacillus sp. GSMTC-2017]|uniref:ABC transporter ATP-binding protein n=1 Tax=Paenibacillus sp. GSMTC-2017 TaxID=2794350 RepID=UPI0018D7B182|nr:ABC transporter ATP-binding protein [Paenibacillus sp. GSMTC-2017]MBH5317534.1 ABC transporter ATP-binding protein [Paenibacillus sp. GSMTC-2017]